MLHRRAGFTFLEVTLAMAVVLGLAVLLGVQTQRQDKVIRVMAERRAAVRQMEALLTKLQTGDAEAARVVRGQSDLSLRLLDDAAPVNNWRWAEVSAPLPQGSAQLIGLVRVDNATAFLAATPPEAAP